MEMESADKNNRQYTAFCGITCISRGSIETVAVAAKIMVDAGEKSRIAIFDDQTGQTIEIDFRGNPDEVVERLAEHPLLRVESESGQSAVGERRPGPGRPRLGVISREISLLPRHWEWLAKQEGGTSGALRRLVEQARKLGQRKDLVREAQTAVHRFMWDMAGNQPHFEEASRAFYARDYETMQTLIKSWPTDIRAHVKRLVQRLMAAEQPPTPG